MTYRIVAIPMILCELQGHSPTASFLNCHVMQQLTSFQWTVCVTFLLQ